MLFVSAKVSHLSFLPQAVSQKRLILTSRVGESER